MSTPVVLIGWSKTNGSLISVGLYATKEDAQTAVQGGRLVSAFYSMFTPEIGHTVEARRPTDE